MLEKPISKERAAELKKLAADFQPQLQEQVHVHYDDVQNAMLEKAKDQKLTWEETKVFSEEVHRLRREQK